MHYCLRLREAGVDAQGAILRYPKTRRTVRIPWTPARETQARADVDAVLTTVSEPESPPRLSRPGCRGCGYTDYCWTD
jgi:CRISPR-associated exonuclease Cas4